MPEYKEYQYDEYTLELTDVQRLGLTNAASLAIDRLLKNDLSGFWILDSS